MGDSSLGKKAGILLLQTAGIGAMVAGGMFIAYNSLFSRYERPDYSVYPGDYIFSRLKDRLEREELHFLSGENRLAAYYYPSVESKGLVLIAHGFHSGADDYLPITEHLVRNGYSVFSYDCTGAYSSEGKSTVGMCQALVDIDAAIGFIQGNERFKNIPLFLIGHSLGGYAVASVLEIRRGIHAAACIAPMNNGYTVMLEKSEKYVGRFLTDISRPIFNIYQKILFQNYTEYSGVRGINSVNIPVLIAHGIDDNVITYNGESITARAGEITNPNVIFYETRGLIGDHNNIWHSIDAVIYQRKLKKEEDLMKIKLGRDLSYKEKREFYSKIDHSRYSAVNEDLMNIILNMFESTV